MLPIIDKLGGVVATHQLVMDYITFTPAERVPKRYAGGITVRTVYLWYEFGTKLKYTDDMLREIARQASVDYSPNDFEVKHENTKKSI